MTDWDGLLKKEEQTVFRLRALFEQYGYRKFKMSKFEEYDFLCRKQKFFDNEKYHHVSGVTGPFAGLKTRCDIIHCKAYQRQL